MFYVLMLMFRVLLYIENDLGILKNNFFEMNNGFWSFWDWCLVIVVNYKL